VDSGNGTDIVVPAGNAPLPLNVVTATRGRDALPILCQSAETIPAVSVAARGGPGMPLATKEAFAVDSFGSAGTDFGTLANLLAAGCLFSGRIAGVALSSHL